MNGPHFSHVVNAAVARCRGQDNMAAAAGRYYGEGGRATKRQKTEDGGMTTVRCSALFWHLVLYRVKTGVGLVFKRGILPHKLLLIVAPIAKTKKLVS